jgi:hypothetical protein
MYHYIVDSVKSQDFLQRVYLIMGVSIELYRVLVSSLLIIFIPQNCSGNLCTMKENLESKDYTYNVGLTFNFISLGAFIILYICEISRENKLIKYLEVNPRNPRDNESLEIIFDKIPANYREKLYRIDYYYKKFSYSCVIIFIVNVIISGIVIYKYSLGNQTTTNFITNILFMVTKVYDTYYVANTEKSIFYSAYMRDHVQFNDIDPALKKRLLSQSLSLVDPSHYELVANHTNEISIQDSVKFRVEDIEEKDIIIQIMNDIVEQISSISKEEEPTELFELEQVKV